MSRLKLFAILILITALGCKEKPEVTNPTETNSNDHQTEVLLIGTFHYNNPGADVAKTKSFDILSDNSQLELEQISADINEYNPSKVFVEWPFDEQQELDSLYNLYKAGDYFKNDSLSDFYLKNEIFQLAFRVAKKGNHDKVYAIDYKGTEFPYQKVMEDIENNNQTELKGQIEDAITEFTTEFDDMIDSGTSLKDLTLSLNTAESRYKSNDIHNNILFQAGSVTDLNGVHLTSEWYKRNLYMWSFIRKQCADSDKRIMVLAGASHAAMFELFIDENRDWRVVEIKEVLAN